jgi:hypothetical protein
LRVASAWQKWSCRLAVAFTTLCVFGSPRSGRGEEQAPSTAHQLLPAERSGLGHGERVERPLESSGSGGRYVGGLSYVLVRGSVAEVFAVLRDPRNLGKVLPKTRRATLIERSALGARVEIEQGTALVRATYTVRLSYDVDANTLRFWLDPGRPHDIDDLWGFFRVTRFDSKHALITLAAMVDVGDGLSRLFERSVQRVLLRTPSHLRDVIQERGRKSESGFAPTPSVAATPRHLVWSADARAGRSHRAQHLP